MDITPLYARVLQELWELNWRCENRLSELNKPNTSHGQEKLKPLLIEQQQTIARALNSTVVTHRVIALICQDQLHVTIRRKVPHVDAEHNSTSRDCNCDTSALVRRVTDVVRSKLKVLAVVNSALEDGVDFSDVLRDLPPVDKEGVDYIQGLDNIDRNVQMSIDKLLVREVATQFMNSMTTIRHSLLQPFGLLWKVCNPTAGPIRQFLAVLDKRAKVRNQFGVIPFNINFTFTSEGREFSRFEQVPHV